MKIGITLTSSLQVAQEYIDLTEKIANKLADAGHSIVYGGTSYGMMLTLADAYLKSGGKELIGITSEDLIAVTKGYQLHPRLSTKHIVKSISERKDKILAESDAMLILPGGYGTVEELITIISGQVNKLINKPIAIYNHNNFYDTLIGFLTELQEKKFTKIKPEEVVYVSTNIDQILEYFTSYRPRFLVDKFV